MKIMNIILFVFIILNSSAASKLPNIVFILTDDQDIMLGGVTPMLKTQQKVGNEGVTFVNAFATTPICCPSRSSILTGKYLHNHRTVNNSISGGCSSDYWQREQEPQSFASHLKRAGYTTFYAGKYLNQYGHPRVGSVGHIPSGWDWWIGLVGNSRYYNYTLSVNGTAEHHGNEYETDYLTDVIGRYGLNFLKQKIVLEEPFMMMLAPPAPHAPFTPAPQYEEHFSSVSAPRTPNFNVPVDKDKHWLLRMPPTPLPQATLKKLDLIYKNRWRTLLSVDDLVDQIVTTLDNLKLLDDTFVIFTSDHGYHIGQFGLPWDKRQPYDFDLRVPLLMRGPDVPKKQLIFTPVLNIDFAPTFLDMAKLTPPEDMDGTSFLPILSALKNNGSESKCIRKAQGLQHEFRHCLKCETKVFLIEYHGEGNNNTVSPSCPWAGDGSLSECVPDASCKCQDSINNTYECVRIISAMEDFVLCQFYDSENFVEAYNITGDPYQMFNIAPHLPSNLKSSYNLLLHHIKNCNGKSCHISVCDDITMNWA